MPKGKIKRTSLQPWQKEITKQEWEKKLLSGVVRGVGFNGNLNKYYETDFTNPAYLKARDERVQKKRVRHATLLKNAFERGINKGKRLGIQEFKKSDKLKKLLEAATNKGIKLAKPKQNLADKVAKAEAKAKEFQKKADAIKAKIKKN